MAYLYSDGNPLVISWAIRTADNMLQERRKQADIYKNKVSVMQAKFVAMHVGLFWGIGIFAIRNGDAVRFMIDDPHIMAQMESHYGDDMFIDNRIKHIDMLVKQRRLDASLCGIKKSENPALLDTDHSR